MQRIVFIPAFSFALCAALTGCDSPSLSMAGSEKREVSVGGSTFSVHWLGDRAEVYRTSMEFMPHLSVILANATIAIEQATGCAVRPGSVAGDPALIKAQIDCG